jgi:ABC-2 type transport system ATP-binding protein
VADNIAISVEHVSKDFILPHEKVNSIKGLFTSTAKRRGRKGKEIQHALKDISFEVKKGEFFGIVGRNGSGKSTLLKILAGIYQQNAGTVHTWGKLVPFIELGVGFNPELTGRENVYLNGAMLGFSEKEVRAMYKDIVDFAELERFMDQKLKNYSSGMQVRLAFSLATRAHADILLIDEVLAVGDADFQRKCFEYFKKLKKDKTTVVFVSHDMAAVREYCDRAMLIEDNRTLGVGSTEQVASQYLQLFMGDEVVTVEKDKNQDRWGDKAMYVSDISASVGEDFITITQSIKASRDMERPIAGFRIRDGAGEEVTGTNTKIERESLPDFKAGETATIVWTVPNIFSDGQYFVDPSLLYENEITVSDWWNDATSFTIKRDRHLPYSIDPGFKVKIK